MKIYDPFTPYRGLWITGGNDGAPEGSLRRAKNVHAVRTNSIRSRLGSPTLYNIPLVHSLTSYLSNRYQADSVGRIYRNAIQIGTLATSGVLINDRLTFVKSKASYDSTGTSFDSSLYIQENLYFVNGSSAGKINPLGVISGWGISPPTVDFDAQKYPQSEKPIEYFNPPIGNIAGFNGAVVSLDATFKVEGGSSLKTAGVASVEAGFTESFATTDLTTYAGGGLEYSGTTSPDEDYITLWVLMDNPTRLSKGITLVFYTGGGSINQGFSRTIPITDVPPENPDEIGGAADITQDFPEGFGTQQITDLAVATLRNEVVWQLLKIPKKSFSKVGTGTAGWEAVSGFELRFFCLGTAANVWVDYLRMVGGTGLQGTYKYHVTFLNSSTGARSNPNPNPVTIENVERQSVNLFNLPISTDPQVTAREIWRTVGNGTLYFKIATISDNTSTSYVDRVIETTDLWSAPIDALTGNPPEVMENLEIQFDNIKPFSSIGDTFGPFNGTLFWCRDTTVGAKGRVYYSPIGRAEAIRGFIQVTPGDDDPTQKGIVWNGVPYVFTRRNLFQIIGTQEPFIARKVTGASGTNQPFTVVGTPSGILYQSDDGVYLFNGIVSMLVGFESIGTIFRGESTPTFNSFEGVVAELNHDEYLISDENTSLALNLKSLTWREVGLPFRALYWDDSVRELQGALTNGDIRLLEKEGTFLDGSSPIPFDVEFPGAKIHFSREAVLQRLYIDINTNGELLIPELSIDGNNTCDIFTLPGVTSPSRRRVEIPVGKAGRIFGVRLTGNLSKMVEIFSVDAEVYMEGKLA